MSETPSAYSVEEHMFNQDEIQKRHPQQQRSDAVTELQFHACPSCGGLVACNVEDQSATIAELRAEVAKLKDAGKTAVRLIHSKEEQIVALQARVAELEAALDIAVTNSLNSIRETLRPTPTTEK